MFASNLTLTLVSIEHTYYFLNIYFSTMMLLLFTQIP